ncbi:CHAT domain-containing protein [Streptomyces sp. NPDC007205]|uniref:CHAT domain-containing protein n=1 Tax=Streptomyces sp. NPDC007205 TaxID=3154316 RepID=UPI0034112D87
MPEEPAGPPHLVDRRMALAREWDALVEQARTLDGYEDFLRPPRLETLLPAAANGPVAVINVSRWRCDALIVTTAGVRVVPLPRVTLQDISESADAYVQVLQQVDRAAYDVHIARQRYDDGDRTSDAIRRYTAAQQALSSAVGDRDTTLAAVLAWLWDEIADPVLTALGFTDPPAPGQHWPRLWWCPTGPLTILPLHAAGHHTRTDREHGRAVLDRVVSSYTPTLRALLEARRPLDAPPPDDERVLVVALPDAPDGLPLAHVPRERDLLLSLFPGRCTLLEGERATADAVRGALPRHRWAHFSCHGGQDLSAPSRGGLLLHDRILTVADIGAQEHHGEFAFLSACMTATGGIPVIDEATTLVAALHYTGYRQVMGTLWSVYDDTAAMVTEAVYADLTSQGRFRPARSAHALHKTVRALRDSDVPVSAWSPFTHTGP